MVDAKVHEEPPVVNTKGRIREMMEGMRASIGLFVDKVQVFVLEEG